MTTYCAVFLKPGSRWDPEKPVREQPLWDEHARYMDAIFATGVVVLGGPFADRTGSLVILEAPSASHARELYREDPWTVHDVLVVADVKEWTIFLDGRRR
jgi:uncharacterized protein YciI